MRFERLVSSSWARAGGTWLRYGRSCPSFWGYQPWSLLSVQLSDHCYGGNSAELT
jgi:hypothetical protein